ncbi:MAG TPA: hypothetical protein VFO10_02405 [Oligoflexus sp.]|uniref:hypothetical protein n=1 Tax=Oligoflexus sp. TaxID=1971216 RepID=UPI002D7FC412|nr:hypothetical protein [Oligoflexus sp.]HET9236072.1 hypothetical protein [Oligoflexus sp.]
MRQLLIVPLFGWALFSSSCQKSESKGEDTPPINTVDSSVQNPETPSEQNSGARPSPGGVVPGLPPGPGNPEKPAGPAAPPPQEPAPTEGVISLSIQSEGAFLIGHKKKLRAIAQYDAGVQRDVPAVWTLVTNEAEATLDSDGHIKAKKKGKVGVRAAFGGQLAEAEFTSEEPMLKHKEDQFWVYRLNREMLSFNSPWDKVAGNGIVRSSKDMPDFAKDCLDEARQNFSIIQNQASVKERFGALIGGGTTAQLIFLVNVVPVDGRRSDLRRLDRDAYFWHWMREDQRPSLTMSRFQQGSWVWEVIASPGECLQPDPKEIQRYLDYVAMRLVHVQ